MALFGGQRDARLIASINAELINAIIDTEIEFFKLHIESSNSNIYGESISKSYYDSILIPCLVTKDDKTSNMDDYGHTYTRTAQFAITRDILERASFYPEVGDIIFWDNEYYEIDSTDANQYFAGKNPETWPNVLPLPAFPKIKLNGVSIIKAFAAFCSSDNESENLISVFGGVFSLFAIAAIILNF